VFIDLRILKMWSSFPNMPHWDWKEAGTW
jgi:hypothetical protein